ncbi:MAG: XRE family transcriptional regulator [Thermotaleaceae bacterium]
MKLQWEKLRDIRKEKGLTLVDLSEKTGLSSSLISQIERGLVDPTVNNFWKLCRALDVYITDFFRPEEENIVIRAHERQTISFRSPNAKVRYQKLTPNGAENMEVLLIEIEPGIKEEREFTTHKGEECGFVISGELIVYLEDKKYHLKAGDSISFKSSLRHKFENHGTELSRSIWSMTVPSVRW